MGHLLHQPHPLCVGRTGGCIVNGPENGFQMGFVWGRESWWKSLKLAPGCTFGFRFSSMRQNKTRYTRWTFLPRVYVFVEQCGCGNCIQSSSLPSSASSAFGFVSRRLAGKRWLEWLNLCPVPVCRPNDLIAVFICTLLYPLFCPPKNVKLREAFTHTSTKNHRKRELMSCKLHSK